MNQSESLSATRNSSKKMQGAMKTIQKHKLEIELPENAYNLLAEIAFVADHSIEQHVKEMIYSLMDSDLDGGGDEQVYAMTEYLCKKYNYVPRAWRKEEASA